MDDKLQLVTALIKAQQAMGPIKKDSTATVPTKSGGSYKYSYVDLGSVLDAVIPALHENNLTIVQTVDLIEKAPVLVTTLLHTDGESIKSIYPLLLADATDPQKLGACVTYARRYSLMAILGLAPEDDDATSASTPPARSTYTPAGTGNGTAPAKASSSVREFDLNTLYPCEVPGCTKTQEGKWAEISYNKFDMTLCGMHWKQAKEGTLDLEVPTQQSASDTYGADKEPLPWE